MPDKGIVIVEGAKLTCTLGIKSEAILKVKHKEDDKYFINEKKIGTWLEDKKEHFDFGNCKRNPKSPPPCTPKTKWSKYYNNAEFGTQKILLDCSKGNCSYGGQLDFLTHGQTKTPSNKIYKKDKKDSYDIFLSSPTLASSSNKKHPAVNEIQVVSPIHLSIPSSRAIDFEIGGKIKEIILEATKVTGDKSLVSWVLYKGENQSDRIFTFIEYGSRLKVYLDKLPEGKTTIYGYGQKASGDKTKIIIDRKKNKLENIEGKTEIAKYSPVTFTPKYTFEIKSILYSLPNQDKIIWRIKEKASNKILYTSNYLAIAKNDLNSIAVIPDGKTGIIAVFKNSGTYIVELEDRTLAKDYTTPDIKTLTVTVKNRSVDKINNLGSSKIRRNESFHLKNSPIKNNYGIFSPEAIGLGNKAFWYAQKDNGTIVELGLFEEVKMTATQLQNLLLLKISSVREKQSLASNIYGSYKFQVFGEKQTNLSKITFKIGSGDVAYIEVAKNRTESIEGQFFVPIKAKIKYKAKMLMPLVSFPMETVAWHITDLGIKKQRGINSDEIYITPLLAGTYDINISLEGTEVSTKKLIIPNKIIATQIRLTKALWCYKNGKRRTETGWDEENYLHLTLEGAPNTPVLLKVWAKHPDLDKEASMAEEICMLKEITAALNSNGSCQVPFITDEECKKKLGEIFAGQEIKTQLFFTLEFPANDTLDMGEIDLYSESLSGNVPVVHLKDKNNFIVLDEEEALTLPAEPRITAINFSNEARTDLQITPTLYGKKHYIWVNTVAMVKEKLAVKVYKHLLKEDLKETYNEAEKAFQVAQVVKEYPAQEVGTDGVMELEFSPQKKDADGDPQMFFITVFKEVEDAEGNKKQVEAGSQLKTLDSLPHNKELSEDMQELGISMPTLEDGQDPTEDQLKKVISCFFHFHNPLYVSESGTIEDWEVVSPVLVERGESKSSSTGCLRCTAEITITDLIDIFPGGSKDLMIESLPFINEYFKLLEISTCFRKAQFFAQVRVETGFVTFTENLNYTYDQLMSSAFKYYIGNSERCKNDARKSQIIANNAYNGRMDNRMGTDDGWNFRGRGLIQTTGRSSYNIFQKFYDKNRERLGLSDIIIFSSKNFTNETPERLAETKYAVLAGVVDWVDKGCNILADNDDGIKAVNAITAKINYHTPTYSQRQASYEGGKWMYKSKDGKKTFSGEYKIATKNIFKISECGKIDEPLVFGDKAPWIKVAISEYSKYKTYFNPHKTMQGRIEEYCTPHIAYYTLWCAAFVHWCFKTAGYEKIHDGNWLAAFGFKADKWTKGESCEAFVGAVIVFSHSHVAFIIGQTKDKKRYVYLGGNQGGSSGRRSISINSVAKDSDKIWITKPKSYTITEADKNLPLMDASTKDLTYEDTHN